MRFGHQFTFPAHRINARLIDGDLVSSDSTGRFVQGDAFFDRGS